MESDCTVSDFRLRSLRLYHMIFCLKSQRYIVPKSKQRTSCDVGKLAHRVLEHFLGFRGCSSFHGFTVDSSCTRYWQTMTNTQYHYIHAFTRVRMQLFSIRNNYTNNKM